MPTACSDCGLLHPAHVPCISLRLPTSTLPNQLADGTTLAGRYCVARALHRGGMSIIYLASDDRRGSVPVAIKELCLPLGATPDELREAEAWFARESFLLSALRHPLIPEFHSVFRENDRAYIAQDFVEGVTLQALVHAEGPVGAKQAVAWGRSLCGLLHYLHILPEPVIFRDLKPANILLRAHNKQLAVVDFGIARPWHPGAVTTVIGTPGYAPPEQYQGLATPQSDVYALGAVLHHLLTGYDAEQGAPFTFPAIRELNPTVSTDLAAVIECALQLNPAQRYASIEALDQALHNVERGAASMPSAPHTALPRSRPVALAARIGSGVFALLALGVLGYGFFIADQVLLRPVDEGTGFVWMLDFPALWLLFGVLATIAFHLARCAKVGLDALGALMLSGIPLGVLAGVLASYSAGPLQLMPFLAFDLAAIYLVWEHVVCAGAPRWATVASSRGGNCAYIWVGPASCWLALFMLVLWSAYSAH